MRIANESFTQPGKSSHFGKHNVLFLFKQVHKQALLLSAMKLFLGFLGNFLTISQTSYVVSLPAPYFYTADKKGVNIRAIENHRLWYPLTWNIFVATLDCASKSVFVYALKSYKSERCLFV